MKKILRAMLVAGSAVAALAPVSAAHAEAPMVKTQAPGYYRMMLGQFEVTALHDGALELDVNLLKNARGDSLNRMLARMFVGTPKMQTAVNAYLINTGSNLVLVDAGAAKLFGPGLGHVVDNMRAAGYDPAQVDTVIVTHLHGDHIGGLNDSAGQMAFPNAAIHVPQSDNDFWMSQEPRRRSRRRCSSSSRRHATLPRLPGSRPVEDLRRRNRHRPGIRRRRHTVTRRAIAPIRRVGRAETSDWGDVVHAHAVQFAQHRCRSSSTSIGTGGGGGGGGWGGGGGGGGGRGGGGVGWGGGGGGWWVATRKSLMYSMAATKTLVAGMHLPFPASATCARTARVSTVGCRSSTARCRLPRGNSRSTQGSEMTYEEHLDEVTTLITEKYDVEDDVAIAIVMRAQADGYFSGHTTTRRSARWTVRIRTPDRVQAVQVSGTGER